MGDYGGSGAYTGPVAHQSRPTPAPEPLPGDAVFYDEGLVPYDYDDEGLVPYNYDDQGFVPYHYDDEPFVLYDEPFVGGYYGPYWPALHNRLWVRAEYLLWWLEGCGIPPLVTTSPPATPPADAGILGGNTSILFGSGRVNESVDSGGRLCLGWWFGTRQRIGVEASYLGIARDSTVFQASSDAIPILARPYFDLAFVAEAAMLVAHPNFLDGSIRAEVTSELQAAEVLFRRRFFRRPGNSIDFVFGYRFARLDESIRVDQFSEWVAAQAHVIPGTTKHVFDLFGTENQFHGAEVGVVYGERMGFWSLELLLKLGLGNTHSQVFIDGATRTTVPGAGSATFLGGLLAQETNIGRYERDDFTVIPELGMTLSRNLTPHLRATFGYTLLYWSKVARPGDLIDLNVSQLPPQPPAGGQRPRFTHHTTDFWAQGMNFGLDYRF